MSELSILIDESGDFGETRDVRDYYLVTFVFHDQSKDITPEIKKLKENVRLLKHSSPGFTPPGIIPTGGCTTAHTVITVHPVILTEHLALFAEPGTPRVAAGSFRLLGHFRTSIQIIKKPRSS